MFTWAKVILAALRLIEWIIGEAQKHAWINEGEDRQIAKAMAELIRKQTYAKETLASIERLSDEQLDNLLHDLAGPNSKTDSK